MTATHNRPVQLKHDPIEFGKSFVWWGAGRVGQGAVLSVHHVGVIVVKGDNKKKKKKKNYVISFAVPLIQHVYAYRMMIMIKPEMNYASIASRVGEIISKMFCFGE